MADAVCGDLFVVVGELQVAVEEFYFGGFYWELLGDAGFYVEDCFWAVHRDVDGFAVGVDD